MPRRLGLRRDAPRLLGTVEGKPHAGSDDHEDCESRESKTVKPPINATGTRQTGRVYPANRAYPSPPSSNSSLSSRASENASKTKAKPREFTKDVDLSADPRSSDDDEMRQSPVKRECSPINRSPETEALQRDGTGDERPAHTSGFKKRRSSMTEQAQRNQVKDPPSSDEQVFGLQPNRLKTKHSASAVLSTNIHAAPKTKAGYGSAAQQKQKAAKRRQQQDIEKRQAQQRKEEGDKKNTFQRPNILRRQSPSPGRVPFQLRRPTIAHNSSSPLSDLPPSSDQEPLHVNEEGDLLEVDPTKIQCAICGEQMPREWKAEFEDTLNRKRQLSYKWQQRFCRYHSEKTARDQWEEQGYPDIDWITLPERLKSRKHLTRLKKILSGEAQSRFRDRLQSDQKQGARTLMDVVEGNKSSSRTSNAGYYGPRGEQLMTSSILTQLAPDIRAYETSSTLFSSSGIFGGVAGFVQAVLVPELALSLLTEDLAAQGIRKDPLEVLKESANLGELIHPEEEDRVVQRSKDDRGQDVYD